MVTARTAYVYLCYARHCHWCSQLNNVAYSAASCDQKELVYHAANRSKQTRRHVIGTRPAFYETVAARTQTTANNCYQTLHGSISQPAILRNRIILFARLLDNGHVRTEPVRDRPDLSSLQTCTHGLHIHAAASTCSIRLPVQGRRRRHDARLP